MDEVDQYSISFNIRAFVSIFVCFRGIWDILGRNHNSSQPAEAYRLNYPAYNWVIWSSRNMTWGFSMISLHDNHGWYELTNSHSLCCQLWFCRSPKIIPNWVLGSGRGKFQVGGQRRSGDGAFRAGCRDDGADLNHFFGMGMCRLDSFGR